VRHRGSAAPVRAACADFGRALGVAFQLVDDILDFSEARFRQGRGAEDLRAGKLSYAAVRALERLDADRRRRLEAILLSPVLRQTPEAIAEGVALVRASGALDVCRAEARAIVEAAWRALSQVVPPLRAQNDAPGALVIASGGRGWRSSLAGSTAFDRPPIGPPGRRPVARQSGCGSRTWRWRALVERVPSPDGLVGPR